MTGAECFVGHRGTVHRQAAHAIQHPIRHQGVIDVQDTKGAGDAIRRRGRIDHQHPGAEPVARRIADGCLIHQQVRRSVDSLIRHRRRIGVQHQQPVQHRLADARGAFADGRQPQPGRVADYRRVVGVVAVVTH